MESSESVLEYRLPSHHSEEKCEDNLISNYSSVFRGQRRDVMAINIIFILYYIIIYIIFSLVSFSSSLNFFGSFVTVPSRVFFIFNLMYRIHSKNNIFGRKLVTNRTKL